MPALAASLVDADRLAGIIMPILRECKEIGTTDESLVPGLEFLICL
jgi:hypothetical protein